MPNTNEEKTTNRTIKKKHIVKTSINIDFKNNEVEVLIKEIVKILKSGKEENEFDEKNIQNQVLFSKKFEISGDYKSVIIDEKIHEIPSFFNRETIKIKDLKTWEMIFYYIFEKEISEKVRSILSKYKEKANKNE